MEGGRTGRERVIAANWNAWRHHALELRESRLQKVLRLIAEEPCGRLLDPGCGAGEFSAQVRTAGWEVVGLDLVQAQAALAGSAGIRAVAGEASEGLPSAPRRSILSSPTRS